MTDRSSPSPNRVSISMFARVAVLFLLLMLFPFPIAGRWDWWGAWATRLCKTNCPATPSTRGARAIG